MLTAKELAARKLFVDRHLHRTAGWWTHNMNLVLDGVTLTKAPESLSGRQKHAAQRISHMWMRKAERACKDTHTFNRYGCQLGLKVPL